MAIPEFIIGQALSSFPGGTLNKVIRTVNELKAAQQSATNGNKSVTQPPPCVMAMLIWNGDETPTEGETILPPGASVILGDPVELPEDESAVPYEGLRLYCDQPTEETKDDAFAILQTPFLVPAEGTKAVAYGYIPEACWAQVTINDSGDDTAELVDAQDYLSSSTSGRIPIIWKPTGTGLKWCVVQLAGSGSGGATMILGVATSNTTSGVYTVDASTGTLIQGSLPSGVTTVSVNDTFGWDVTDERQVLIVLPIGGDASATDPPEWETIQVGCPPEA